MTKTNPRHLSRRRFLAATASLAMVRATPAIAQASEGGLPKELIEAARREGSLVPYEPFPTEQSKPMADAFSAEFGIPNKFFRAGQEALQARVEAEIRAGSLLADTIAQSDLDVVQDMLDRGLVDTEHRPAQWDQYPERWRFPHINNIAFAILACNMIYNNQKVSAAEAPHTWEDLVAAKWKGQVVVPSPEYAGTGFALLAEWVKRYGWDFVRALKANDVFVVQAVSDSDRRVISGQKLVGIANSHRASTLLSEKAPITLVWSKKTPPVALSYVHVVFKKAPNPHAARLYRDFCLTPKMQSAQAKVGLWSAHPKAVQPANIPHFDEVALAQLDYTDIRKNRQSLLEGWKNIMRG
jgi:iron(III) transport system substrate-binding protein